MRSVRVRVLVWLLLVAAGCGSPTGPSGLYQEGIVTALDLEDQLRTMLVDSDPGADPSQGCATAAYYRFATDTRVYRLGGGNLTLQDLAVGKRVSVEYDGVQLESCPPIRTAERIFVH